MFQWISQNSAFVNAVANIAMLAVWITYLSIFLHSYGRQMKPKIVINQAAGSALSASCFVSNMSSEAVYVETVVATLRWDDHEVRKTVTDFEVEDPDNNDPQQKTFQGPLGSGDYVSLGTFNELISRVVDDETSLNADPDVKDATIEILVVADHLSDDMVVGAHRTFIARRKDDRWLIKPQNATTHQIRSRREREKLRDVIKQTHDAKLGA